VTQNVDVPKAQVGARPDIGSRMLLKTIRAWGRQGAVTALGRPRR
jgi:hypothetical protein